MAHRIKAKLETFDEMIKDSADLKDSSTLTVYLDISRADLLA